VVINSFKQTIMKQLIYTIFLISISLTARSQGVGINTTSPKANLHVKGSGGMDPFIVEYGDSVKLKTFQNGGTSVGSDSIPSKNGLYVKGTLRPDSGIVTPKKLIIESVGESITLKAGRNTIVMDADGNINITSDYGGNINIASTIGGNISITSELGGNINIESNSGGNIGIRSEYGNLDLYGNFVNINATTALKIKAGSVAEISSTGSMDIKGGILKLNGGGTPVAKSGSTTSVVPYGGGPATIIANTSPTVLVP
jgi:hypothetical protein